jgi:hypothetical protein
MEEKKIVNWYNREILKDELEIKTHKTNFIKNIKKVKKTTITNNDNTNVGVWKRMKKILYTLKNVLR